MMTVEPKAVQRIIDPIHALLLSVKFAPEYSVEVFSQRRVFNHAVGYFTPDDKAYLALIAQLQERFPQVAQQTVVKLIDNLIQTLIVEIVSSHQWEWDKSFSLNEIQAGLVAQERLVTSVENLLRDLASLVREYTVFVPLTGVELSMPKYDLGPVSLVRTVDSMPALERTDGAAEFQYVHSDIYSHFASIPCLVEIPITGDSEFARQEGVRLASQLAAILNLHFAERAMPKEHYQKIQSAAIASSAVQITLVRTQLPDANGAQRPTYLPGITNVGFFKHNLTQTQLNMVKASSFDLMWRCLEQRKHKSKSLGERIRRAVLWFDKAVNFDEPDAQFVGLATALEILLIGESNASITQQLADRCAFLLGDDLESTIACAVHVKKLYGVRSGIVHSGKEPTASEVVEMTQLASRVILDFVQRNFRSFEHFEEWIKRLHYSVNLNEIERYRQLNEQR